MYAKYINENEIEIAPKNKGAVYNYDTNEELLKKDGYKKVTVAEKPDGGKEYAPVYKQTAKTIKQSWKEVVRTAKEIGVEKIKIFNSTYVIEESRLRNMVADVEIFREDYLKHILLGSSSLPHIESYLYEKYKVELENGTKTLDSEKTVFLNELAVIFNEYSIGMGKALGRYQRLRSELEQAVADSDTEKVTSLEWK